MIEERLQRVVSTGTIAAIHVDMTVAEVRTEKIRGYRTVVGSELILSRYLIDVAIPSLVNLMAADIVQFEYRIMSNLILSSKAILITQGVEVRGIEGLQQCRWLWRIRIEGSKLDKSHVVYTRRSIVR